MERPRPEVQRVLTIGRWLLSAAILLFGVYPETGLWTTLLLAGLTAGFEIHVFDADDWKNFL